MSTLLRTVFTILLLATPLTLQAVTIAATLPPLAGIVAMLDEQSETFCLLPAAADPHHFQLQPRKIEQLKEAALLLRASADDGGWPLPPTHTNTLDLWPDHDHSWLSPSAVTEALPRIAAELIRLNPERRQTIEMRLQSALTEIASMQAAWQQQLVKLRDSGVVMQHPAWRRLMQQMQVPILAVLESGHHGHEHGPHALDEALHDLDDHPGALLLKDSAHINRSLNWLADHAPADLRQVSLDALGSCDESWLALMQRNLDSITQALK